jgi:hypothetical protein
MFLPAIDSISHNLSATGHPRYGGLNSIGKRVPIARLWSYIQQKTWSKVLTAATSLHSLIPHMHVPPQEVCPFSTQ